MKFVYEQGSKKHNNNNNNKERMREAKWRPWKRRTGLWLRKRETDRGGDGGGDGGGWVTNTIIAVIWLRNDNHRYH